MAEQPTSRAQAVLLLLAVAAAWLAVLLGVALAVPVAVLAAKLAAQLAAQQQHQIGSLQQYLVCAGRPLSEAACPTCKLLLCLQPEGLHSSLQACLMRLQHLLLLLLL